MSDDLKLSLNRDRRDRRGPDVWLYLLIAIVLIVVVANLYLSRGGRRWGGDEISPDGLEELAIKFEQQRLAGAAARAWIDYLEAARPGAARSARIWYRIGTIYQEKGDYELALEAFYRSEAIGELEEIENELSRRIAECLEGLGRFAALRFELEERTSITPADTTRGGEILAEIGSWKISRSDLDMMIETEIDAQLAQLAVGLTSEQKREQKEILLENILKQGQLGALLERFIAEELLTRSAREQGLHKDPKMRRLVAGMERKLLAQTLLGNEYDMRITITPQDIERYYQANLEEFKEEERQKTLDEVTEEVYAAVRMQKELEVNRQVLEELKERYDVVIHRSKLGGE
jgi:hypothetical protein